MKRNEILGEISDRALKNYRQAAHTEIQGAKFGRGKGTPEGEKTIAKREKGMAAAGKRQQARSDAARANYKKPDPAKTSSGPQDWYGQNRYMGDSIEQSVAEGSEFGSYYYEKVAQQIFDKRQDITSEDEVLNQAYHIVSNDQGQKSARYMFNYDEDFPSDVVSAYFYLQKKQGVSEAGNKPLEKSRFGTGDTRTPRDIKSQMQGASDEFVKSTADSKTGPFYSRVAKMQGKMAKSELRRRGQGVVEGKEDKIAQLKKDHETAVHWSKNETSPQKREAARQKAEKIKRHLDTQYKQGVMEVSQQTLQSYRKKASAQKRAADDVVSGDADDETWKKNVNLSAKRRQGIDAANKRLGVAEEQLDELSNNTLASYKKKAGADATQADKRGDYARGDKRMSGIIKATKKEFDNDEKGVAEGVEYSIPLTPRLAGLVKKLRAAIRFYGELDKSTRIDFTDDDKWQLERLLSTNAPSDNRGVAILKKALDGHVFDQKDKPEIAKLFKELLALPQPQSQPAKEVPTGTAPAQNTQADNQGMDAFSQGIMAGLMGSVGGPAAGMGMKAAAAPKGSFAPPPRSTAGTTANTARPTAAPKQPGATPPPAPGTMANPIRRPGRFMGPADVVNAPPRLKEQGVAEADMSRRGFLKGLAGAGAALAAGGAIAKGYNPIYAEKKKKEREEREKARPEQPGNHQQIPKPKPRDSYNSIPKEGVAESATPASVSKVLRLIQRHHSEWFDTYGLGEVEDTVVDMADMDKFYGLSAVDAIELVGQELESMYGQQVDEEKQRLDPKCWAGYKKQGTKMKGDTRVNNCVPVKESAILKGLK